MDWIHASLMHIFWQGIRGCTLYTFHLWISNHSNTAWSDARTNEWRWHPSRDVTVITPGCFLCTNRRHVSRERDVEREGKRVSSNLLWLGEASAGWLKQSRRHVFFSTLDLDGKRGPLWYLKRVFNLLRFVWDLFIKTVYNMNTVYNIYI